MSSTFTSRKGNPKNKKKSIAQFQQEKQSISQPSCASAVRLQQELGTLSTADQRLIETIETAAFQQIRSGYSTKFDRFDAKVHRKDHKNAQELLQKALHFIDRQDYRQALKLLNEGVLHANHEPEVNGKRDQKPCSTNNDKSNAGESECSSSNEQNQLGQILMQRALCLQRLEYLDECVADVDALLAIGGIGSRTRDRLRKCRSMCRQRLNQTLAAVREDQSNESLLAQRETFHASSKLFGASDAIRIEISPSAGRGLFARTDLPSDHLVLDQSPYCSVLSPQLYGRHCYHCLIRLSKSGVFIACRSCTRVRYCSIGCERSAWTEGHHIECGHLELLQFSQDFHLQPRLALKIVLKSGLATGCILQSSEAKELTDTGAESEPKTVSDDSKYPETSSNSSRRRRQKNATKNKNRVESSQEPKNDEHNDSNDSVADAYAVFSSNDYKAICSLRTHSDQCPDFAPPICMLLLFLDKRIGPLSVNRMQVIGVHLLRNLQRVHCNSKYVFERQLRCELGPATVDRLSAAVHQDKQDLSVSEPMSLYEQRLGLAIYTTYSLCNHHCSPNVLSLQVNGDRLVLKTLRPIAAGEQLNVCYGVTARWHSYAQRFLFLRRFYFFICDCDQCIRQTDAVASCFKCNDCGGAVRPLLLDEPEQPPAGRCSRCPMRTVSIASNGNANSSVKQSQQQQQQLLSTAEFVKQSEQRLDKLRQTLAEKRNEVVAETLDELNEMKQKADRLLHEQHQLHWRILQLRSLCYRTDGKVEEALVDAVDVIDRLDQWCGPSYSAHLNARVQLLDRALIVLKQRSDDDRLRLRFMKTLKTVKEWMDDNLMPSTDEYMYLLSLLSLCFTGYSQLGVRYRAPPLPEMPTNNAEKDADDQNKEDKEVDADEADSDSPPPLSPVPHESNDVAKENEPKTQDKAKKEVKGSSGQKKKAQV